MNSLLAFDSTKEGLSRYCLLSVFFFLCFFASLHILASTLFIFGFSLNLISLFAPFLFSLLILRGQAIALLKKEEVTKTCFCIAGAWLVLGMFFSLICSKFYDLSADGQSAYLLTIDWIRNGVNPVFPPKSIETNIVFNYYSKGHILFPALIGQLTGNIEAGKSIHFLYMVAASQFAFAAFLQFSRSDRVLSLINAVLLAASPVAVSQSFTYYSDGILGNCLVMISACFFLLFFQKEKILIFMLGMTVMLISNVKIILGLVYPGLFCCLALGLFVFYRDKMPLVRMRKISISIAVGFFVGIFLLGYQPHVTSSIRNRNPFPSAIHTDDFFSVAGIKKGLAYASGWDDEPPSFAGHSVYYKILYSYFSKTRQKTDLPELKYPFTVGKHEIHALGKPDNRIGGFGPQFGGLLILSLFAFLLGLKRNKKTVFISLYLFVGVFLSLGVSPNSWNARYGPQGWMLVMIPLVAVLLFQPGKITRLMLGLLLVFHFWNFYLVFNGYYGYQKEKNAELRLQLEEIAMLPSPVKVDLRHSSNYQRFNDYNIEFEKFGALIPFVPSGIRGVQGSPSDYEKKTGKKCIKIIRSDTLVCP